MPRPIKRKVDCDDQFPINEIADPNPMQRTIFPRKAAHAADISARSRSRSSRRTAGKIARVPRNVHERKEPQANTGLVWEHAK